MMAVVYTEKQKKQRNEAAKRWQQANSERSKQTKKEWQLRKKYGMTQDQWDAMLVAQHGACASCGTTEPGGKHDNWVVDHDHETGAVRALLCHGCNTALGLLDDDPTRVLDLFNYIAKTKKGRK